MRPFVSVLLVAVPLLAASGILVTASPAADRRSAPKAITFPDQALLENQRPPQCQLSKAPEGINPNEALVVTLDYERQCYRQAEEIVRAKLDTLQAAVRNTVKADNNSTVHKRPVHRHRGFRLTVKDPLLSPIDLGR